MRGRFVIGLLVGLGKVGLGFSRRLGFGFWVCYWFCIGGGAGFRL